MSSCISWTAPDFAVGPIGLELEWGAPYFARMGFDLGDFQLERISGGRMRLDGGTMFGVVPRTLWQRHFPPDESNRIALECNCLLVRTPDRRILIDTGYGGKCSDKQRHHCDLEPGNPILDNLAAADAAPERIDTVILTHLHFDHAGGATLRSEKGLPEPAFPNAEYIVQKQEWDDATADLPELAGAYFPDDFIPLRDSGQLRLIEGGTEVAPGVSCQLVVGHTRGHQIVWIESRGRRAVFLADLCPLVPHLRTVWSMAYDQFPLEVRRIKPKVLQQVVDSRAVAIFEHDSEHHAGYLEPGKNGEFSLRETLSL